METVILSPKGKKVVVGPSYPTAIVGERIHPFGKSQIKKWLEEGDFESIVRIAREQVEQGADILNINVAAFGLDEAEVLPRLVERIIESVDIPISVESRNPQALKRTLDLGLGKPIINSVSGEQKVMDSILPIVKEYKTALIVIASSGRGIPGSPEKRLEVISTVVEELGKYDIPLEDILVDCVVESVAINSNSALNTLRTMKLVKERFDLNLVLGASNISFGLPQRSYLNAIFLGIAIIKGLNCAITDPKIFKPYIVASDLLAGKDNYARRYTSFMKGMKQR